MKRMLTVAKRMLSMTVALGFGATALAETYTIDSNHTFPQFEISHLSLSTFRGRFDRTTGTIELDRAKKQGSIQASIDVKSVSTGVEKLDQHLQTADFFDAEKYPTIEFKASDLRFQGDKLTSAAGQLTLRGVTKPVTLTVTAFACKPHPMTKKTVCGADVETRIKRSDFGMTYGVPNLGEEVILKIGVEANLK